MLLLCVEYILTARWVRIVNHNKMRVEEQVVNNCHMARIVFKDRKMEIE